MSEIPELKNELTRKGIDVLIDLQNKKDKGIYTHKEYSIGLKVAFDILSGLTLDTGDFRLIDTVTEMSSTVDNNDPSFRRMVSFENENEVLLVKISERERVASVKKMNVEKCVLVRQDSDESFWVFQNRVIEMVTNKAKAKDMKEIL